MLLFYEGCIVLVSHPDTNPAGKGLTSVNFGITKLSDAQRARLNLWSTCQPRSQCFSLLFYLLFFRDWNAVVQYHTIQCLLSFCNTYHRQPSVCITEASRFRDGPFDGRGQGGVGKKPKKKFMQGKMPRKKFTQRRR